MPGSLAASWDVICPGSPWWWYRTCRELAANYRFKVAATDGTAIGVLAETLPLVQALQNPGVQYDAAAFTCIGRVASSNNIHLVWHTAKVKSL